MDPGGDRSFRQSSTPVMQAGFFLITLIPALIVVAVIAFGGDVLARRWIGSAAAVATVCLLANLPWLFLCQFMRRRLQRRLRWISTGCCAWCGYDLAATPEERPCPECGRQRRDVREQVERAAGRW